MQDTKAEIFELYRRTLEGIAYRMLGSLAEAQDVVQDTYLKWHKIDDATLENPRAWLMTVCTRTALTLLQSARKRRETYVGEWLPEPYPDEPGLDPGAQAELKDTVSIALLVALEKLSPVERAVFLLHDVFELSFGEIGDILERSSANCRQLAVRARTRIRADRPRFRAGPVEHRRLLESFISAARDCNVQQLIVLLAEEVETYSDGGGKAEALPEVLRGAGAVAQFFASVFVRYRQRGVRVRTILQSFNGSLGVLIVEDKLLSTALTIEADAGSIRRIYAVRNPDKLHGLRPRAECATPGGLVPGWGNMASGANDGVCGKNKGV